MRERSELMSQPGGLERRRKRSHSLTSVGSGDDIKRLRLGQLSNDCEDSSDLEPWSEGGEDGDDSGESEYQAATDSE